MSVFAKANDLIVTFEAISHRVYHPTPLGVIPDFICSAPALQAAGQVPRLRLVMALLFLQWSDRVSPFAIRSVVHFFRFRIAKV